MGRCGAQCLFHRLGTESPAVSLFRAYKVVRPNEMKSTMRTREAKRRNEQIAFSAEDAQMPNLARLVAAVTLHILLGMANGARLFVGYRRCLQMNLLSIHRENFMKLKLW